MEAIELLLKEKQNPVESGETVAPTSEIVDNDNPELK
jgi:hypothetical protein